METTAGAWDTIQKSAGINATGYKNERYSLLLRRLTDTGYYPNPSIENIYYSDGADFQPSQLKGGYILISLMDRESVKGEFSVLLQNSLHGTETGRINGNFGINIP